MITNVLTYLKRAAQNAPEQCAFADQSQSLTYGQVWRAACSIGGALRRRLNGCRNRPILVSIDRRAAVPVAFLGVTCSGNFYMSPVLSLRT